MDPLNNRRFPLGKLLLGTLIGMVVIELAPRIIKLLDSMSEAGRAIGPAVNLSRQRGQTLIFIVQEVRQLDVNVISQGDVIAIKELSEISREFERRELRKLTDRARVGFSTIQGDKRKWTWVYSEKVDFAGLVANQLASFWRPSLGERASRWVEEYPVPAVAGAITLQVLGPAVAELLRKRWGIPEEPMPVTLVAPESPKGLEREGFTGTANGATPATVYQPPPDSQWLRLAPHPSVILVIGKRGSGKSALGYRLLELYRDAATPYVVGLPTNARKFLPEWAGVADRLEDVPPQAVVLLDEAYIQLHARTSMSEAGRAIGPAVNLSRQRGQTLIFIVQEARQLDVNVISQADVIAVKELSELSKEFERRELRKLTDKARAEFNTIQGDRRKWTWVYSEKADFSGLVENQLASFWRPSLSQAFAATGSASTNPGTERGPAAVPRKGTRTPKEDLAAKAEALHRAGHSYRQIAKILGIPRSSTWDLVNGP